MEYHIYTDGACKGNPGRGGWGAIAVHPITEQKLWEITGKESYTTNNRMELMATIRALDEAKMRGDVQRIHMYTDSTYVAKGITSWIKTWKVNQWKTSNGQPVKNFQLWKELSTLTDYFGHRLAWSWVKAHAGNKWNNAVDKLASSMCYTADTKAHGSSLSHHVHFATERKDPTRQLDMGTLLVTQKRTSKQSKLTDFFSVQR